MGSVTFLLVRASGTLKFDTRVPGKRSRGPRDPSVPSLRRAGRAGAAPLFGSRTVIRPKERPRHVPSSVPETSHRSRRVFQKEVGSGKGGLRELILLGTTGHAPARRKEYSFATSLVARGFFDKAIEAYENAVLDDPLDSEPYLRIGRLYRDELDRPDDAVLWFKRARREAALSPVQDLFISRELVELYRDRMGKPEKALTELARIAELHPGTPEEAWAKSELRRLKTERVERGRGPVSEPEA